MSNPTQGPASRMPAFRARAPWWGGHLQTLRNKLVRPDVVLPGRRERFYFTAKDGSGDMLAAMLDTPDAPGDGPLIVLIHGLAGSEDSDYMRLSAAYHLKRRRRVLRLNLRGAGPSRRTCGGQYHCGSASDVRDALLALDDDLLSKGLFLIGYSLGGNVLMNFLASHADRLPIRGSATVSAAIDPAQAARRLMAPQNAGYHFWLLKHMKRECTSLGARLDDDERGAISYARTLYEFDDMFVAPRNGFAGADDYYARTAGWRVAAEIRVPMLLIHARNDPWIPPEPYDALRQACGPNIEIVATDDGGHVGFHARDHNDTWHDRRVGAFIDTLCPPCARVSEPCRCRA